MKLKLIALVSLLVVGGVACGKSTSAGGGTTPTPSTSTPTMASANTIEGTDNLKFTPAVLTVKAGTKVTWKDVGAAPHTVTFKTIKFDKTLDQGTSISFVFAKAGTYHYICKIHATSNMKGTVVVQ